MHQLQAIRDNGRCSPQVFFISCRQAKDRFLGMADRCSLRSICITCINYVVNKAEANYRPQEIHRDSRGAAHVAGLPRV